MPDTSSRVAIETGLNTLGEKYRLRINLDSDKLEDGDPVVSDYILDNQRRFIPFLFKSTSSHPKRTLTPMRGHLLADLCFPYGDPAMNDRLYGNYGGHLRPLDW